MKQFCLAILIVFGLGAASVEAREVIPLEVDDQDIAATLAMVDGQNGLFMFDSGIGTSGITPDTAKRIGCIPWGKVTGFRAIGERLDLSRCNATSVTLDVADNRVVLEDHRSLAEIRRAATEVPIRLVRAA